MNRRHATQTTSDGYKRRDKTYFKNCKNRFLDMYGRFCSCCGESEENFLTIEHIHGQKGLSVKDKKTGAKAYREATQEYRPDLYRTLCYNCNLGRRWLGYCPHEVQRGQLQTAKALIFP